MKELRTKLENEVNDDWKFAIKNALLILACPIIVISIGFVSIPIFIVIGFRDFDSIIRVLSLIGLFVSSVIFFKVILNFIDYYKEKYKE